ncbi:leucine-rich repeat domain-containing protein [Capnocytophaga sputigena]|uniref:leucine-rich repeat domain-containing protein n=1 Tax=Capnocytophaga sputigena TaxID=1019 RepID=UPI0028E1A70B|nr:leucine-rich repeat domain-containing protein [Capnocytophaga sputigena]
MNKEIQFYSDYDGNDLALLEINNASDKTILQLKEIENHIIRLRFEESPKSEKLQVLSEVLAQPHKSVFILQLLRENNQEAWINIEDFKSVWNVEQLFISNRDWGFDSLKGIEYFQNLKELVLVLRYDKNLSLTPLEACYKLEKINLELPLTKKQHQELSMLQSLKKMNVRGLQTDLLQAMPAMEFLEVQGLQSTDLDKKMPNLKELLLFNSNKLEDISFISGLIHLESLSFLGANKIATLPSLSELKQLTYLSLMNMKELTDIFSIKEVKQLRHLRIATNSFRLEDLSWLVPEVFPFLESITIKLKTMKETRNFLERFPEIGKIQYD